MANDIGFDLDITKLQPREHDGGVWVFGTTTGYKFQALVFPDHADSEAYELGRTRISKLWVQRLADRQTTFNFDRGWDVPAKDAVTQQIVAFLGDGLADFVFEG
jgi:hypothetical protein